MKANPTTKKFFQLVDIPDYRFAGDKEKCSHIDLGISIMNEAEEKNIDKNKLMMLSVVISDLAELAIATNKIAISSTYSSGYKDAENA